MNNARKQCQYEQCQEAMSVRQAQALNSTVAYASRHNKEKKKLSRL